MLKVRCINVATLAVRNPPPETFTEPEYTDAIGEDAIVMLAFS